MPANNLLGSTRSKTEATRTLKTSTAKTVHIPLTSFENFEQLDNTYINNLCEYNRKVLQQCIMCEQEVDNGVVCEICDKAQYCSWDCQVDDQQHHALLCREWAKFREAPKQGLYRIIIFPALTSKPVLSWSELTSNEPGDGEGNDCPRITFHHPEIWSYTKGIFSDTSPFATIARMGCINRSHAVGAPKSRLGHGLFLLEWVPPPGAKIDTKWINRSIPAVTNRKPGLESWLWTGSVAVAAFDLSKTNAKARQLTLEDVTPRDVRHAIDFFTHNLRNPVLLPPSLTSPRRFPLAAVPAVRLNETNPAIAKWLGVKEALQEVHVARDMPDSLWEYQGLSVVCSLLGLAWIVRVTLCHGQELDWLYEGYYTHPVPTVAAAAAGAVDETHLDKGVLIPWELCLVWVVDPATGLLQKKMLPRSGDGVVMMHASGEKLRREHVRALLEYLDNDRLNRRLSRARQGPVDLKEDFRSFWKAFRLVEKLSADVPSPYDMKPSLERLREDDRFVVCKDIFRHLVPKLACGMIVLSDGTCTYS